MTAKRKLKNDDDPFAGVVMHAHGNRSGSHGGGSGAALPRITPIAAGRVLSVFPDDEMVAVMKAEGWAKVKAGFRRNGDGELPSELFIFKSTDGNGVIVRYYKRQRPNIHVSMPYGRVAFNPNAGACSVRRVTDGDRDAFVFDISDQITMIELDNADDDTAESVVELGEEIIGPE